MKELPGDLPDALLWNDLKAGDREALAQLYQRYVRTLYSYGRKITQDEKLVEDSIQDLFVGLWLSRKKLGDIETARFYLFRSLRRRICKSSADDALRLPHEENKEFPVNDTVETRLILHEESRQTSLLLNKLIRDLPDRQGEAVVLYFYGNLDYHEIGELLSINEQSARNLVHRALEKLKKNAPSVRPYFSSLLFIQGLIGIFLWEK